MAPEKQWVPKVCKWIDGFVTWVGKKLAWLNVVLVLAIIVQVTLRYGLGINIVALEEMQWHLYGLLIMFGIAYDIPVNKHIRLDLLHRKFPDRARAVVEFLGILFLLLPMVTVIFIHSLSFVASSYRVNETSDSPLGLPYRWAFKSVIPASISLVALAAISRLIRSAAFAFGGRKVVRRGNGS